MLINHHITTIVSSKVQNRGFLYKNEIFHIIFDDKTTQIMPLREEIAHALFKRTAG